MSVVGWMHRSCSLLVARQLYNSQGAWLAGVSRTLILSPRVLILRTFCLTPEFAALQKSEPQIVITMH